MPKTYLAPDDVILMENEAKCPRDRILIRLLFHLGCRVSEVLSIKVSDVDFEQGNITIIHLKKTERLSCPYCKTSLATKHQYCPGCGQQVNEKMKSQLERRRIRVLPVDDNTLQSLRDYIGSKELVTDDGSNKLFTINRHRVWQIVRECARRAGLPQLINPETGRIRGISPHRLRDAFSVHAMKLDNSGDGLRLLQEHLGHSSFNTTAKYRKIAGDEHRQWYRKLWG